jgi:hypothetical protein
MKTKQELLKILEKNYYSVQKEEYQVYDNTEKNKSEFSKNAKAAELSQKENLKEYTKQERTIKSNQKETLQELKKAYDIKRTDIDLSKKQAKDDYNLVLKTNKEEKTQQVNLIKEEIEQSKNAFDQKMSSILTDYNNEVEESKKRVNDLKEKSKKDEKSYETLVKSLSEKHQKALSKLDTQKQAKLDALNDANRNELASFDSQITELQAKRDQQLDTLQAVYEEELSEIEEKIATEDLTFNEKYALIKDSAQQRTSVREKHLNRALEDKDSRSAKAHKRDILKIQKEMDRDLQLLQKNYDDDHKKSLNYKHSFIKENYEKWTDLKIDYLKKISKLNYEKDLKNATLDINSNLSKLEFESKEIAELESFHKESSELLEKRYAFQLENQIHLENEALEQSLLQLRFDIQKQREQSQLNHTVFLHNQQLKIVELTKEQKDLDAKLAYDSTVRTLEHDLSMAKETLEYKTNMSIEEEQIMYHNVEHTRHDGYLEEMKYYEASIPNFLLSQQENMISYEKNECINRYNQLTSYLTEMLKELGNHHNVVVKKAKENHLVDIKYYQKRIKELSEPMLLNLNQFKEEETIKIEELEAKIRSLHPRKDRKEKKTLLPKLESMKSDFENNVSNKQKMIDEKIATYQLAMDQSIARLTSQLEQLENLYNSEKTAIENQMTLLQNEKEQTLSTLDSRLETTNEELSKYIEKRDARFSLNQEQNKVFLDSEILKHTEAKNSLTNAFNNYTEEQKTLLNADLAQYKASYDQSSKDITSQIDMINLETQKQTKEQKEELELLKTQEQNQVEQAKLDNRKKVDLINEENNQNLNKKNDELKEQLEQHKDHLAIVNKNIQAEQLKVDTINKDLSKKYELSLQQDIQLLQTKLKEDISKIA